ncbi:major facilitator superfamily transporter [Lecanosticta acicola]|uniref:Major facilitator superfamily transporter n=1 Tax=Lecanosticta acicola TaxID=111012 RepID=A0AAI9E8Q7_9PEZI|nr:major facilitator superfamily transporter [Lecanosticta acicola]
MADETQPLLRSEISTQDSKDFNSKDIVEFDPNGDPDNPLDWPAAYRWSIVALLAVTAFCVTFTCISLVPVANQIIRDLNGGHPDKSASVMLVTIWELGEAAGPLFIAPLSEVFGRYPVMNAANILLVSATLLASFATSPESMVFARFLSGLAVASNVLSPAIVGDMFVSEQRGTAMSLIMFAPLLGGAIGPAISGAIAQSIGWRTVLWMSAGLAGVCEVVFLTCFRETFKVPILNRRAARLRKETGNQNLKTIFEIEGAEKKSGQIWESVMRPVVVLAGSGVLQIMSLFGSVAFSYFYVMSTSLPDILQDIYGLNPAETGFAFISFSVGSVVVVILCNLFLDKIYIRLRDTSRDGLGQPEFRLPFCIFGGFLLSILVALYGWTAELKLPLVINLLSVAGLGGGLTLASLPLMAYVVDAFGLYSASALTAVIVTRCLMGTFLPLATDPLVRVLGHGKAYSLLGAVSLCLAPIPLLVMRYGRKWRQRSKYTRGE